jgi:hypothetical protein
MRRFELHRDEDASGVSGTGVVAQGIEFGDGTCVLRWLTGTSSTGMYANARDVCLIHGHGGRTRLVWLDPARITVQYLPGGPVEVPPAPESEHVRVLSRRQALTERMGRQR